MWINNTEDIKRFEDTIDQCRKSVIVVTMSGAKYDLKKSEERNDGIFSMLNVKEYEEPEVFAGCPEDEMLLFDYLENRKAA